MRKLVLITGGTSGIGRAIADVLVEKYDLALGFKENSTRAKQTAVELTHAVPAAKIRTYKIPLHNHESCKKLFNSVTKDFSDSPLFGLIHCAGSTSTTLFLNSDFEDQLNLIQEHLVSGMALAHLCLPSMYSQKSGRIIFMSSIGARYAHRGHSGYAAAKSGIEAFSRTLALEVAHRGITVNCVAPGLIDTALTQEKIKNLDKKTLRKMNPTGLLPQPRDVATLVQYLMMNKAKFITGTSIPVDGGQSLGAPES